MDTIEIGDDFVASASLFDGVPFLKATAHTEGDDRFLLIEPTNENRDIQGEIVPRHVLAESADYFQKFGNIDISHKTHPAVVRKLGIENPREWEIGRPVEVKIEPKILVKAQVYVGHKKADWFWDTQVNQRPPMPWFPSIGGSSIADKNGVLIKCVWDNIGLDPHPVNKTVPHVRVIGADEMLKALVGEGGTDKASLDGGAALRRESLHGAKQGDSEFYRLSNSLISAIENGGLGLGPNPSRAELIAAVKRHFAAHGVDEAKAAQFARRFITSLGARARRARAPYQAAA